MTLKHSYIQQRNILLKKRPDVIFDVEEKHIFPMKESVGQVLYLNNITDPVGIIIITR